MLRRILIATVLTFVVSFYLFPVSFTFIPQSINSKMLVAAFGVVMFIYDSICRGGMQLSRTTLFSSMLAIIFSLWCCYAVIHSSTYNYVYGTYIVSYMTWMAGAYGVYAALRLRYGEVHLPLLTRYLTVVCLAQCAIAILIDNYPVVMHFVDRFIEQGQDFYRRAHRLYGIGAALDPGGIRFSAVLVLLAHQVATNEKLRARRPYLIMAVVAFALITIFGAVISRTTLVGSALGLAYMFFALVRLRRGGFITIQMVRTFARFLIVVAVVIVVTILVYNKSQAFRNYFRFGFEAFFNWVETGVFHTTSTDTLTERMWIWPTDPWAWVVGQGTFGIFQNNTDIGYCNFILYCGIIGLTLFSIFFLYCHLSLNRKFNNFQICSLLLIALTFIIWIKVTTDIFLINALLFCIEGDDMEEEESVSEELSPMVS